MTLTKEQMFEAQEMFRTANKVTRPEKALILGFMAGSRDNPCPHLGTYLVVNYIYVVFLLRQVVKMAIITRNSPELNNPKVVFAL